MIAVVHARTAARSSNPASSRPWSQWSTGIGSPMVTTARERNVALASYANPTGTMDSPLALLDSGPSDSRGAGLQWLQGVQIVAYPVRKYCHHRAVAEQPPASGKRRVVLSSAVGPTRFGILGAVDRNHPGRLQQPLQRGRCRTALPSQQSAATVATSRSAASRRPDRCRGWRRRSRGPSSPTTRLRRWSPAGRTCGSVAMAKPRIALRAMAGASWLRAERLAKCHN